MHLSSLTHILFSEIEGKDTKGVMEFRVTQVQILLCQGMPVQSFSQFQTHWTNVSSNFGDDEPALLTIHTLVDTFTYFEQD